MCFDLTIEEAEGLAPGVIPRFKFPASGQKIVFLAEKDGEPVVLKFYPPDACPRRLQREITALNRIDSPHVVKLIEFFYYVGRGRSVVYSIEEFVNGADLLAIMLSGHECTRDEVLDIMRGTLSGLDHLYRHHVVHRDITPRNIIIRRDGTPVIIDFGVMIDLAAPPLPGPATPPFASPEVARQDERHIDCRSDIFALGMSLYCLINRGIHPVWDDDLPLDRNIERMQTVQAPPPSEFRSGIDPAVSEIIYTMVQLNPARRFQTPAEALDKVEEVCSLKQLSS